MSLKQGRKKKRKRREEVMLWEEQDKRRLAEGKNGQGYGLIEQGRAEMVREIVVGVNRGVE